MTANIKILLNSISHLAATNEEPAVIHIADDVAKSIEDYAKMYCFLALKVDIVEDKVKFEFMGIPVRISRYMPAGYFVFADAGGNILKIGTINQGEKP